MQQAVLPTRAPSPARRPTPTSRRRSGSFSVVRPALRRTCGNCREMLAGPLSRCWMCGAPLAGVRWGRLLLRIAIVGLAAAAALIFLL